MLAAKQKIQELVSRADPEVNIPKSLKDIEGEWELVLTTVPHGIFRSSPFFLAIQEAFEFAEDGSTYDISIIHLHVCLYSIHILLTYTTCTYNSLSKHRGIR